MSTVCHIVLVLFVCLQASHLETETISYEEKEQQLVNDCVKELREYWIDCTNITINVLFINFLPL